MHGSDPVYDSGRVYHNEMLFHSSYHGRVFRVYFAEEKHIGQKYGYISARMTTYLSEESFTAEIRSRKEIYESFVEEKHLLTKSFHESHIRKSSN